MESTMTDQEIEQLLTEGSYGHLACYNDGEIYLVPITYTFSEGEMISYTHEGKKIDMLRKGAVVCVQVEHIENSSHWQSVICWGDFEEIIDHDTRQEAALKMAEKFAESREKHKNIYSPLIKDISAVEQTGTDLPVMYRIKVHRMTGRQEKSK